MKKLILAAGAVAAIMTVSSCGHSGAASSFEDSLSTAMGQQNGAYLNMNFQQVPESERFHLKKADVLRGFKEVIMADTAARGYYAGLSIGVQLNNQLLEMEQSGIAIDRARFLSAFSKTFMADTVGDMQTIQEEANRLLNQAQQQVMAKRRAAQEAAQETAKALAKENTVKGEEYVKEQMAKDPEIKKTESGLAYKVIKQGEGKTAGPRDRVKTIYKGSLIDGTEFDSSKGEAVSFVPTQTVPGFSEALQMMSPGSKYVIYIPASLGYGDRATGSIPPGSTLVFEVEVTEIDAE